MPSREPFTPSEISHDVLGGPAPEARFTCDCKCQCKETTSAHFLVCRWCIVGDHRSEEYIGANELVREAARFYLNDGQFAAALRRLARGSLLIPEEWELLQLAHNDMARTADHQEKAIAVRFLAMVAGEHLEAAS